MYRITYDGLTIFDPYGNANEVVSDASMSVEVNASAYLDFTMAITHPLYDTIRERAGVVTLTWDSTVLFEGIIESIEMDIQGNKSISCVSAMDYLNDTHVRPYSTVAGEADLTAPSSVDGYFQWLIDQHNDHVLDASKIFDVGINQGANLQQNNFIYRSSESEPTTASEITDQILDSLGGYLTMRYEDGRKVLDLYADLHTMNAQIVDFGVNITDFTKTTDTTDQYTAILLHGGSPTFEGGDLEAGDWSHWETHPNTPLVGDKTHGGSVASYFVSGTGEYINDSFFYSRPGRRYKATVYVKNERGSNVTIRGSYQYEQAGGWTTVNVNSSLAVENKDDQWVEFSFDFQPNLSEYTKIRPRWYFDNVGNDGNRRVYLDDFSFSQIEGDTEVSEDPIGLKQVPDGVSSFDADVFKSGDVLYSTSAVERYGYKEEVFEDTTITNIDDLVQAGIKELNKSKDPQITLDIKAVDLALFMEGYTHLNVGDAVRVRSAIHDTDEFLMVNSITLDLQDPGQSEYVIGKAYDSLTGQQSGFLRSLNSGINSSLDAVASLDQTTKDQAIKIGSVEQVANQAKDTANNAQNTANNAQNTANANKEAINTVKDKQSEQDKLIEKLQQGITDSEADISGINDRLTQMDSDIEQAQSDIDAVRQEAQTNFETAKNAADAAGQRADAAQEAVDSLRESTSSELQNVKDSVSGVRSDVDAVEQKAADLAESLESTNATVEQVTTDLGEVKTTVSNAATKADQALQVSTSASQTATEAKTTATSAYQDAQSALTQSSTASQTANAVKTELETKYSTTDEIAEQYATKSLVEQTSQSITSTVEATYATKATVEALENIANNAVQTWMGSGVPTLSNKPASDWNTAELKSQHSGDIYYDTDTGYSYRFGSSDGNDYSWSLIKDTDISKAVADAAKAQQTAEGVSDEVTQLKTDIPATYATKTEVKQTTDSIKSTVSEVAATANSALSKATTVEQTANGLQTTVTEQASKIDQNTTTISQVSQKADSLSSTITQVSKLVDGSLAQQYLTNPDFETGDDTGWTFTNFSNHVVNTASPYTGKYKVYVRPPTNGNVQTVINSKVFTVTPGQRFRLSAAINADNPTTKAATLGLLNSEDTSKFITGVINVDSSSYKTYSTTITIPTGWSKAQFRFATIDTGYGIMRLDSFMVLDVSAGLDAQETANSAMSQASRVEQSLDSFKTSVSRDYQTKTDALSQKSELEQNINSFKTTVSETYTTKDEFNNLQIGGTNLIKGSKPYGKSGFFEHFDSVTDNEYGELTLESTTTSQSYPSVPLDYSDTFTFDKTDIVKSDKYVISYDVMMLERTYTESSTFTEGWIGIRHSGGSWSGLIQYNGIKDDFLSAPLNEWAHFEHSITANAWDGTTGISARIQFGTKSVGKFHFRMRNVKLEKGTKATAWSPAPEDSDDKYTSKTEFKQTTDKISATATAASQNASSALSKVSSLEVSVDGIDTRVEEVASDADEAIKTASQVSQRVDSLSSTITQVQGDIDRIDANSQNFITNPQFKSGNADGVLNTNMNATDSNPGVLPGTATTFGKSSSGYDNRAENVKIKFIKNHTYRIEIDARLASDNAYTGTDGLGLFFWFMAADNPGLSKNQYTGLNANLIPSGTKEWTHASYDYKPTMGDDDPRIIFRPAYRVAPSSRWLVTNFTCTDVTAIAEAQKDADTANSTANSALSKSSSVEQNLNSFKTSVSQMYETKSDASSKQSSLQQSVNNLRTEVSETYTTKDEFNNLQIGGTNLIKGSKPYGKSGFFEHFDSVTDNEYGELTLESTTTSQSYPSVPLDYSDTFTFDKTDIVKSDKYVISYDVMMLERTYTESSTFTEGWIGIRHSGGSWSGLIQYNGIKDDFLSAPLNEWAHFEHSITANAWDGTTGISARIQFGTKSVGKFHFRMRNVKLEKGTKATPWSPAPEDLLSTTDAAQTYSTKSYVDQTSRTVSLGVVEEYKNGQHGSALATQSDITATKNSITQTVSQTYLSKTDATKTYLNKDTAASTYATKTEVKQTSDSLTVTISSAVSKAESAATAASKAQNTANTANSTANTAKNNAATAQNTANTAKTNAATAQSTADKANSNAQNAQNRVGNLETCIKMTSDGVRVGKISNGNFTGYSALVNSAGSFDVLDGSGAAIAKFSKYGLNVKATDSRSMYMGVASNQYGYIGSTPTLDGATAGQGFDVGMTMGFTQGSYLNIINNLGGIGIGGKGIQLTPTGGNRVKIGTHDVRGTGIILFDRDDNVSYGTINIATGYKFSDFNWILCSFRTNDNTYFCQAAYHPNGKNVLFGQMGVGANSNQWLDTYSAYYKVALWNFSGSTASRKTTKEINLANQTPAVSVNDNVLKLVSIIGFDYYAEK